MNTILQVGMMSVFVGGIYGGFKYSKLAYEDFMTNNTATSFKTHFEAKVKNRSINKDTFYEKLQTDILKYST